MIHVARPAAGGELTAAEQYGLDTLLDLSGLLRVEDPASPVVALHLNAQPVHLAHVIAGIAVQGGSDGVVHLPRGLLAQVTAIAGAGTEQGSDARDRHGRVPAAANPLVQAGAERLPIVSQWARALRAMVQQAAGPGGRRLVRYLQPWPDRRRWAAAFTHDVDVVAGWPAFTLLRLFELARGGEVRRAGRVLVAATTSIAGDPTWDGVREILEMEKGLGVRSTWFFLCGTPTVARWRVGDVTYDVTSKAARRIVTAVQGAGHELAVHGSFATVTDPDGFARERSSLAAVAAAPPGAGVRQHFLKMRPGATQARMRDAGFTYDATFGFSARNGFRLGVADVVAGWDAARGEATALDEVPLHWMDRAQSKYQGIENPRAWTEDALQLARRCQDVGGLWVGLWHPNLTGPLGYPGAPEAYAELLRTIANDPVRPAVDTLERLVAWRRRRRAARARRVTADGGVEWASPPMPLEDAEGRPID